MVQEINKLMRADRDIITSIMVYHQILTIYQLYLFIDMKTFLISMKMNIIIDFIIC